MKLIVHELITEISQVMIPDKNTSVVAIRPHIYRHNFATGGLKIQIYDDTDSLVNESEVVDIADIASANYFHGYVRFLINAYLEKDQEYKIKLVGTDDYTFNESAYCGWCNGFDLSKYDAVTTPMNNLSYPLDLEIWERIVK